MEIFSKLLSETDCNVRLSIPKGALPDLAIFEGDDLPVKDWTGWSWRFRFKTRNIGQPRPVFTRGWHQFSRAMRLQVGDRIILIIEDGQYTIDAYRRTDLRILNQPVNWIRVDQFPA